MNECLAGFTGNERVIILGDMNAKVGDQERNRIVGKFGVPWVNKSGNSMVDMCIKSGLIGGNTWFEKKMIHKYTWEREEGDEKSVMDYMLVEERCKSIRVD